MIAEFLRKFRDGFKTTMNDAQSIQAILQGLSAPKLTAYQNLGLKDDWEIIQAYIFLMDISSHFLSPLQLLELSLRNKMYSAIHRRTGKVDWYKTIPVSQDSKRQVNHALVEVRKLRGGYSHDDVVCRLMFGFWVYMLDKPYRPSGAQNLWQFIKADVFPGAGSQSIPAIFDELKAINGIRNRLFHHEPLWKTKGPVTMTTALAQTSAQYDRILKVLEWISPEKHALTLGLQLKTRFTTACDLKQFVLIPSIK